MDQPTQVRDRQHQEPAQDQQTPQTARQPERERLAASGQLLQAALDGFSLGEMPPDRLRELAGLLGNQGMQELLARQSLPRTEVPFVLPPPVQTAPFAVPQGLAPETMPPPALPAEEAGARAFAPAELVY